MSNPGIVFETGAEREKNAFPCFCCGICCSWYQVHLERAEALSIARHLGIALEKFLADYTDPRWPGTETWLVRQNAGKCVFLDQDNGSAVGLCRIHDFKPSACLQWTASLYRKECRQGLSRYWGLSVDDFGKLAGSAEAQECFNTFIESLK